MKVEGIPRYFIEEHPQDAARVLEQFTPDSINHYLGHLSPAVVANLFQYLSPSIVSACLNRLDAGQAVGVLRDMGVERASIYLRRMKQKQREELLTALPAYYAGMLRLVLRYPDGTIGQLMDPDVITVNRQSRVQSVIDFIRNHSEKAGNEVYVVNEKHKLLGIVDIKDLIICAESETVMSIMQKPDYCVPARSTLSNLIAIADDDYREYYPVIDRNNHFLGTFRHETLYEAFRGRGRGQADETDLTSNLLIMADLFWKTFLNLLIPDDHSRDRRGRDE